MSAGQNIVRYCTTLLCSTAKTFCDINRIYFSTSTQFTVEPSGENEDYDGQTDGRKVLFLIFISREKHVQLFNQASGQLVCEGYVHLQYGKTGLDLFLGYAGRGEGGGAGKGGGGKRVRGGSRDEGRRRSNGAG
jgi:hypothetical protein